MGTWQGRQWGRGYLVLAVPHFLDAVDVNTVPLFKITSIDIKRKILVINWNTLNRTASRTTFVLILITVSFLLTESRVIYCLSVFY